MISFVFISLGIDYITEIQLCKDEPPTFFCEACDALFDNNVKIPHLIGVKHRLHVLVSVTLVSSFMFLAHTHKRKHTRARTHARPPIPSHTHIHAHTYTHVCIRARTNI